jgi:hypothetical protein
MDMNLGGRAGGWRGPAAGGRQALALEAGAGPLERAVHRLDRGIQHAGHLAGVVAEDIAQDEHRDLAGRQDLQGGHEG